MSPNDLRYTSQHEWARVDRDEATIGITEHAQEELGDVVFVELPRVGVSIDAHEAYGNVESVKAVSELFMPLTGEVLKINPALEDSPELVNEDPYGNGWMVRIRIQNQAEVEDLLSPEDYDDFISKG